MERQNLDKDRNEQIGWLDRLSYSLSNLMSFVGKIIKDSWNISKIMVFSWGPCGANLTLWPYFAGITDVSYLFEPPILIFGTCAAATFVSGLMSYFKDNTDSDSTDLYIWNLGIQFFVGNFIFLLNVLR